MSRPVRLQDAFNGMWQDSPRDRLPKGKAWSMVDWIPGELGAPIRERGGWAFASPDLSLSVTGTTKATSVLYAQFSAGAQLIASVEGGVTQLVKIGSAVSATAITAVLNGPVTTPLVMLANKVIIPSTDGAAAPQKYDGTSVSSLGGSPPAGRYPAVYGGRCWLAHTTAQPQRVYGSAQSDPETWNTTTGWLDVSAPVTGLAALPNVLLVFSQDHCARFRGVNPPPQTDINVDDPIFQYGCSDARSIAVNGSYATFANPTGLYLTNGTAFPTDLTAACGMKTYWRNLFDPSAPNPAVYCGWFGNLVLANVAGGSTATIIFDTKTSNAYQVKNLGNMQGLASAAVSHQELYAAYVDVLGGTKPRVLTLSSLFTPSATFKNDGDGTPVQGTLETAFYESRELSSQRWRDFYLEYDLRDNGDSPLVVVSYTNSPESGAAYTQMSVSPSSTTLKTLVRIPIRVASKGMAFKLRRGNASGAASIYGVGATVYQREGSRLN